MPRNLLIVTGRHERANTPRPRADPYWTVVLAMGYVISLFAVLTSAGHTGENTDASTHSGQCKARPARRSSLRDLRTEDQMAHPYISRDPFAPTPGVGGFATFKFEGSPRGILISVPTRCTARYKMQQRRLAV